MMINALKRNFINLESNTKFLYKLVKNSFPPPTTDKQFNEEHHKNSYNSSFRFLHAGFPLLFLPTIYAKEKNDDESNTNRRDKYNFIADAVEQVLPAIVHVELKYDESHSRSFFSVPLPVNFSSGSGFIVSSDGIILTNAHVVKSFNRNLVLWVKLKDGRNFRAKILKVDNLADLAIIKIDCDNLKGVKLGDSSKLRTGEFVIALGNPLTLTNTITSGIVSNPSRDGRELGLMNKMSYIQTDSLITLGSSGGPLVNLDGEVIGINSMTTMPGISFAIPSKYAIELLKQVQTESTTIVPSKAYHPRYIGIKMITITPQLHISFNRFPNSDIKIPSDLTQGCLIVDVMPNSPSELAGLKRGDIIVKANDENITCNSDLLKVLEMSSSVDLTVIRNNMELFIRVNAE